VGTAASVVSEATDNSTMSIRKLESEDNYPRWSAQLLDLLLYKGTEYLLRDDYTAPTGPVSGQPATEEYREWQVHDRQARAILRDTVDPTIRDKIVDIPTSKEMWEFLKQYQPKGATSYKRLCRSQLLFM
jgi:hypothetical protein